jgi:hypothetical protein
LKDGVLEAQWPPLRIMSNNDIVLQLSSYGVQRACRVCVVVVVVWRRGTPNGKYVGGRAEALTRHPRRVWQRCVVVIAAR